MPGNTECTKASTLNSMARKLTSTPTLPPTIPRINSSTRGRCRYGRVRISTNMMQQSFIGVVDGDMTIGKNRGLLA